jgi:hypothetical protein
MIRDHFRPSLPPLQGEHFDAIFSISVLEHLSPAMIANCFDAMTQFLRPGGFSIHCFDFILDGIGDAYDFPNAERILESQAALAQTLTPELSGLSAKLRDDLETFYLSPQGHHLWRGGQAYAEFPFRKVVSLQTLSQRAAKGS